MEITSEGGEKKVVEVPPIPLIVDEFDSPYDEDGYWSFQRWKRIKDAKKRRESIENSIRKDGW